MGNKAAIDKKPHTMSPAHQIKKPENSTGVGSSDPRSYSQADYEEKHIFSSLVPCTLHYFYTHLISLIIMDIVI